MNELDELIDLRAELGLLRDRAARLVDRVSKNPLYTPEVLRKVDAARADLEKRFEEVHEKIKTLRQQQKEKEKEPEPTPSPENTQEEDKPEDKPEPKPQTSILASVGVGGRNNRNDALLVQRLLNERTGSKLAVDGVVGPRTNSQIIDTQRRIFQRWNVDGRVDPNGATWKWLMGSGSLPALPPKPPVQPITVTQTTLTVQTTTTTKAIQPKPEWKGMHISTDKEGGDAGHQFSISSGNLLGGKKGNFLKTHEGGVRHRDYLHKTGQALPKDPKVQGSVEVKLDLPYKAGVLGGVKFNLVQMSWPIPALPGVFFEFRVEAYIQATLMGDAKDVATKGEFELAASLEAGLDVKGGFSLGYAWGNWGIKLGAGLKLATKAEFKGKAKLKRELGWLGGRIDSSGEISTALSFYFELIFIRPAFQWEYKFGTLKFLTMDFVNEIRYEKTKRTTITLTRRQVSVHPQMRQLGTQIKARTHQKACEYKPYLMPQWIVDKAFGM